MKDAKLQKEYKALYFDLHVNSLRKYVSKANPTKAYREIKNYLLGLNFSHEQYSGYHSKYKTTDMDIFQMIRGMRNKYPWLGACLKRFEVTDVGPNYDLMSVFCEEKEEALSPEEYK